MNTNIEKLKDIQLDMLKIFIEICLKEKLQYFVVGGTALGAVRHKGFIPWDDDIDIGMPREDYEKFLNIAEKYLPENMFLQNIYTDERYPLNFTKLRRSDTTFKESAYASFDINHGVYLDVFPFDGYSQNKNFNLKNKLLSKRISMAFDCYIPSDKIINRAIEKILLMIFRDYKSAVFIKEKLLKKYKYQESDLIVNYSGAWGKREVVPREWLGKGTNTMFEGIEVMLPKEYHKYLTQLYGNYMELPPEDKRVPHHHCTVIDLDKSYKEYI